jgi:iron complex transport system ATP-binding protein
MDADTAALALLDVTLRRGDALVLDGVDWKVGRDDRWVVLGPNGAGKTSLLEVATGYLHPTSGEAWVLGHRLGRVDVRALRERIGFASLALANKLRRDLPAADVVMTARHGALEPWWHHYTDEDRARARALLAAAGFAHVADRAFGVLSAGERQQVLLARTLMHEPDLVLLDEPMAGLDVGAREHLVANLAALAADGAAPPVILVTHHVEEIPHEFTHALLLRGGLVVAAGAVADVVTSSNLSACFGLALKVSTDSGRYSCRAIL